MPRCRVKPDMRRSDSFFLKIEFPRFCWDWGCRFVGFLHAPHRAIPSSPCRAVPSSPHRAIPASPCRAIPGSPCRAVPGTQRRATACIDACYCLLFCGSKFVIENDWCTGQVTSLIGQSNRTLNNLLELCVLADRRDTNRNGAGRAVVAAVQANRFR